MKFTKKYSEMNEKEQAELEPLESLSPKLREELGLPPLEGGIVEEKPKAKKVKEEPEEEVSSSN